MTLPEALGIEMFIGPGLVVRRTQTKKGKEFYESQNWPMCLGSRKSDNRMKRDLILLPFSPFLFFSINFYWHTENKYISHKREIKVLF